MPTYEYRCEDGHEFEVFQRMSDDPLTECQVCGKAVRRVLFPPPVHFKGSGFYATDYGRRGGDGKTSSKDEGGSSSEPKKDSPSSSSSTSSDGGSSSGGSSSGKSETKAA